VCSRADKAATRIEVECVKRGGSGVALVEARRQSEEGPVGRPRQPPEEGRDRVVLEEVLLLRNLPPKQNARRRA
jgi:hypothetical protein